MCNTGRVHIGIRNGNYFSKEGSMSGETKFIVGIAIVTIAIIGGAIALISNQKPAPKREDQGTASMTIDKKSEDFGSMKVSDERTATFTITNTSDSILRIWNIATSCDCTSASIVIGKQTTGEFSMAGMMRSDLANWIGEIPAKQIALLKVTYRPKIMPVQGPVTRQTNFLTNDPKNPDVQVSIAANVQ